MKAWKMSGQHYIHFFCSRSCICSEATLLTLLLFPRLSTWRMCVAFVLPKLHLWTTLSRVLLCFNLLFPAWWHLFLRKKTIWWAEWVLFPTEILAFFTTPAVRSSSLQCVVPYMYRVSGFDAVTVMNLSLHHHIQTSSRMTFSFPVALRPDADHGLLILEDSRSRTTTHHSR